VFLIAPRVVQICSCCAVLETASTPSAKDKIIYTKYQCNSNTILLYLTEPENAPLIILKNLSDLSCLLLSLPIDTLPFLRETSM
jgi:hypothetical protein